MSATATTPATAVDSFDDDCDWVMLRAYGQPWTQRDEREDFLYVLKGGASRRRRPCRCLRPAGPSGLRPSGRRPRRDRLAPRDKLPQHAEQHTRPRHHDQLDHQAAPEQHS
jgi:hypothetical protein